MHDKQCESVSVYLNLLSVRPNYIFQTPKGDDN